MLISRYKDADRSLIPCSKRTLTGLITGVWRQGRHKPTAILIWEKKTKKTREVGQSKLWGIKKSWIDVRTVISLCFLLARDFFYLSSVCHVPSEQDSIQVRYRTVTLIFFFVRGTNDSTRKLAKRLKKNVIGLNGRGSRKTCATYGNAKLIRTLSQMYNLPTADQQRSQWLWGYDFESVLVDKESARVDRL